MKPKDKEIITLNRELGEALGHLQGLTETYFNEMSMSSVSRIRDFIKRTNQRPSYLE